MSAWVDISIPLYTGTVHWPGDPEPILERLLDMDQGEEVNVTFLKMTAHTGTHLDAPCHFLAGGAALDAFPLDTAIGPARVIEIPADALRIGPEHLSHHHIEPGDRLLLKTRNSLRSWFRDEFHPNFASLSPAGAHVSRRTRHPHGRHRLPLDRRLGVRWRRDPSNSASCRHLDSGGAESRNGAARAL